MKFLKIGLPLILLGLIGLVVLALIFGPAMLERRMNVVEEHPPYEVSHRAKDLHKRLIIGDWHADSALWQRSIAEQSDYGHVDIPRLKQGNVALQMFTTVTKSPSGLNYDHNETSASDDITKLALLQQWPRATWQSLTARALYQAEKITAVAEDKANGLRLIKSKTDLARFIEERKRIPDLVGGLIGTEGSHALDGKLENIQVLFDAGFRMMSLQHFFDNKLGGSLHGASQQGLTEFGSQAVSKMVELGLIIDVAHSAEKVVADVLAMTYKPLVVSHTGFKGHCDSARNISDDLMLKIAQGGGLIAVGYWDGAICGTHPDKIAEAIKYGIELVGADHVALGSDFDGSVTTAIDTSELVAITDSLFDAGVAEDDIVKVMGGNMYRFLQRNLPAK